MWDFDFDGRHCGQLDCSIIGITGSVRSRLSVANASHSYTKMRQNPLAALSLHNVVQTEAASFVPQLMLACQLAGGVIQHPISIHVQPGWEGRPRFWMGGLPDGRQLAVSELQRSAAYVSCMPYLTII